MWWNTLAAGLRNAGMVLTPIGVFLGTYQLRVCLSCHCFFLPLRSPC